MDRIESCCACCGALILIEGIWVAGSWAPRYFCTESCEAQGPSEAPSELQGFDLARKPRPPHVAAVGQQSIILAVVPAAVRAEQWLLPW